MFKIEQFQYFLCLGYRVIFGPKREKRKKECFNLKMFTMFPETVGLFQKEKREGKTKEHACEGGAAGFPRGHFTNALASCEQGDSPLSRVRGVEGALNGRDYTESGAQNGSLGSAHFL